MKTLEYVGIGAAVLGIATIIYMNRKEKKQADAQMTKTDLSAIVEEVQVEEEQKYSNALLKQYEVVIPTAVASKRVREKAQQISKDRRKVNPKKIKKPLTINEL